MPTRLISVLAVGLLVVIPSTAQEKLKDDAQLIQGIWEWDQAEKQSDAKPQIIVEGVVVKDDKLTFHYRFENQRSTSTTEFKLDPKATPKTIDFTPTEGVNKGKTYHGIYQLKDGRLKICYRGPGAKRPKDFNDKMDGNYVFLKKPTLVGQ